MTALAIHVLERWDGRQWLEVGRYRDRDVAAREATMRRLSVWRLRIST